MSGKALQIAVCVWEPKHTLARVEAQRAALQDGTVAKLVKKHGEGTSALRSAMSKAKLVTMHRSLNGEMHCPECGALLETLLAKPGIADKVEAVKDIVDDLDAAIERTREARA